jgi:L-rhamnose mutarotase
MQRIAFLMRILPGTEQEYQRRHTQVWPRMIAELKAAGCQNYTIFRDGQHLFAYLEVEDYNQFRAYLARSAIASEWEAYMSDILIREVDPVTNFPATLSEMFHLD